MRDYKLRRVVAFACYNLAFQSCTAARRHDDRRDVFISALLVRGAFRYDLLTRERREF